MDTPPVVGEYVKHGEEDTKESGRPFGFETDRNENGCTKAKNANNDSTETPFALEYESDK